ncbi:SMP-30/gluconolactonase/LRE family protein [candidate division KSB1 bacterium]|nr:SMP-30/gluconolactonase/LRE family protein [candidate division KSB1 bacterium]
MTQQHLFTKIADGFKFPEGPAWDHKDSLYVSNCKGDWITKITPEGSTTFLRAASDPFNFEKTNGMTITNDGSIYACDFGRGAILKIQPDQQTCIIASGYRGKRFNRPNDLAFDSGGNLYFTDPNQYDKRNRDGVVYRIAARTLEVMPAATGLAFPNGIALAPDKKNMYVCESALNRIVKFEIAADGALVKPVVFAELPGGDPDGINFDAAGNLYVAHFGGAAVYVLAADGSLKQKLTAPGKKPTNVEFGGSDLRTLYLTEVETAAVYRLSVEIPGLPLATDF